MWEHIQSLMAGWRGAFIPFLSWIGEVKDKETVKADIIAGITVALVLAINGP